ncbi:unnamed protein product [Nesidiocoris tenuis]|uniref:COX assembly mitochondrial protein n=1 Tax=Nesidiocoris tenuis TaxID=355587 RepID=A0A6H5G933_9HEMI|nr:unnamed protein product [Nesidiocoris tenuis]
MVSAELTNNEPTSNPKNPHGLGDPNDLSLRKVEIEVLIPKKMREKAKAEKCTSEVAAFHKCCSENGVSLVVKCQDTNKVMKECLTRWFRDDDFRKLCQDEYLEERSRYRRTGKKIYDRFKRM